VLQAPTEPIEAPAHEDVESASARQDGADRGALTDVILKLAGEVRQRLGLNWRSRERLSICAS
jgi:hypothetical protein